MKMVRERRGDAETAEVHSNFGRKRYWPRLFVAALTFLPLIASFVHAEELPDLLAKWQSQKGESVISHMLRQRQHGGAAETMTRDLSVSFNYILVGKSLSPSCPDLDITNPNVTGIPLPANVTCGPGGPGLVNITVPSLPNYNLTSLGLNCETSGQLLLYNNSEECGEGTYVPTTKICFPATQVNNSTIYFAFGCLPPK